MKMSLSIDLLTPVNVRSAYDLAQLDPSVVASVTVMLAAPTSAVRQDGDPAPVLELSFDFRRTQMIDLVEFAQSVQPDGMSVELRYQGRAERFTL